MATPDQLQARAVWVQALRSGGYAQGRGCLRTEAAYLDQEKKFRYCCLGVAADVYPGQVSDSAMMHGGFLPFEVARWLGLEERSPTVVLPDGATDALIMLNDSVRKSFEEIADILEAQDDDWDGKA